VAVYYETARLFRLLVTTLHEQNRYTWATSIAAGFHLRARRQYSGI
jgi:hypothetical protein